MLHSLAPHTSSPGPVPSVQVSTEKRLPWKGVAWPPEEPKQLSPLPVCLPLPAFGFCQSSQGLLKTPRPGAGPLLILSALRPAPLLLISPFLGAGQLAPWQTVTPQLSEGWNAVDIRTPGPSPLFFPDSLSLVHHRFNLMARQTALSADE